MSWKEKINSLLRNIMQYNVSDVHILQDKNVYIRNSSWDIKKMENVVLSKAEIFEFFSDFIPKDKLDKVDEGGEVDAACWIDNVRFRINIYQDKDWLRVAMRRISAHPPTMEELGLDPKLKEFLMKDKWLILVTWPTWSWKTTTLASMIEYMNNNRDSHIVTMEDPIEYVYENKRCLITQREIWKNSRSWADAIKYVLRQDPDIVMVWEMRDIETIAAVLNLVETWHLVLSTLHTIDSAQTITRIIDVFPAHQQDQIALQLSLALEMIVSQRLLPKKNWWRVAAREVLINSPAIAKNILDKKISQITSIVETWARYWMKLMDYSMAELVANWLIDEQTVLPKVKNPQNFKTLIMSLKNAKNQFKPID